MDAIGGPPPARGDLHVHSIFSTDSGNYALRRARLRESFTEPERVDRVCRLRGMRYVTITDHNTLEGAPRIQHLPDTFLSEEVTTRFPEDDVVLHVLAWSLTEGDHQDLQPERGSVYALVELLRERSIAFALAHPLYRMGAPITPWHVERMMLLFDVWEGRNGARPSDANILACRLAEAATPSYLAKLTERHGIEARHDSIALTGGSDDHGGLDIATTWTEAQGESVTAFLETVCAGRGAIGGEHGSTEKLAHAVAGLFLNAYRRTGRPYPEALAAVGSLFDTDTVEAGEIHEQISTTTGALTRSLFRRAREGLDLDQVASLGPRLATLLFAGALHVPTWRRLDTTRARISTCTRSSRHFSVSRRLVPRSPRSRSQTRSTTRTGSRERCDALPSRPDAARSHSPSSPCVTSRPAGPAWSPSHTSGLSPCRPTPTWSCIFRTCRRYCGSSSRAVPTSSMSRHRARWAWSVLPLPSCWASWSSARTTRSSGPTRSS
jgi:hypothetical protein